MSVTLPQPNLSWLGQLGSALSPQHQQQMGSGYFPPAPMAPGASAAPATSGGFLQRLIMQAPANQAASNPIYQPNSRLGG